MVPGCFYSPSSIGLVVQLQSKLDLPRIIRSIASGPDLTEGSVREVARASNGLHAVAAKIGRIEVRMVKDVEELSPELHGDAVADLEALEG